MMSVLKNFTKKWEKSKKIKIMKIEATAFIR